MSEKAPTSENFMQIGKGRELLHLYRFFKEKIGHEEFSSAIAKKNTMGGTEIFSVLAQMNLMNYMDSADVVLDAFISYFPDLRVVRRAEVTFDGRKTFVDKEEVKLCNYPKIGERLPQMIMLQNELEQIEHYLKNLIDSSRVNTAANDEVVVVGAGQGRETNFTFGDIVRKAMNLDVSDIHITYSPGVASVLFKRDGILHPQNEYLMNEAQGERFISSVRIEAAHYTKGSFNSDIGYKAQDAKIEYPNIGVDVRIIFIPNGTLDRSALTARILKKQTIDQGEFDFETKMGYGKRFVEQLNKAKIKRNGLFIASGVTGSGKSTLVSHIIATIPPTERVFSIENPIEYFISGPNVTQHQIFIPPSGEKEDKKMDWSDYIKALKRADPDVANIGELRKEGGLAKSILEIAEAGQLVFSTVHIKSAFGIYDALDRVFDIPYDSSATIILFSTNQVLVSKLCPHCKQRDDHGVNERVLAQRLEDGEVPYSYTKPLVSFLDEKNRDYETFIKGDGCDKCENSGYIGRIPVYEYFKPTVRFIEWLLESRPTVFQIEQQACGVDNIGENKLGRYVQLIKDGILDTSSDIIRKIL